MNPCMLFRESPKVPPVCGIAADESTNQNGHLEELTQFCVVDPTLLKNMFRCQGKKLAEPLTEVDIQDCLRGLSEDDIFTLLVVYRAIPPQDSRRVPVVPTELDIVGGRGGGSNNNRANRRYRLAIEKWRPIYQTLTSDEDKRKMCLELVDEIKKNGGRFLSKENGDKFYEMTREEAGKKRVAQNLRETKPYDRRFTYDSEEENDTGSTHQ